MFRRRRELPRIRHRFLCTYFSIPWVLIFRQILWGFTFLDELVFVEAATEIIQLAIFQLFLPVCIFYFVREMEILGAQYSVGEAKFTKLFNFMFHF